MTVAAPTIRRWPKLPEMLAVQLAGMAKEPENGPYHSRPWDLAGLPANLVEPVWTWLGEVVSWLNEHHAWQPETVIPRCWQLHPHIALELATLAFGRLVAVQSKQPHDLFEWHTDLATFYTRMLAATGENGLKDCQRGKHSDRPSSYELAIYREQAADASSPVNGQDERRSTSVWRRSPAGKS
jgi:hypothetical protein